ncbi:MAG TPA: peroxiredoxin [Actinomycetota bacterium]|nr:peroxiredoxin [Actinomycetota bacterium]
MAELEPGMKAPDFELPDATGKTWRLSDLRGKKVILYFYPADDTPGCTREACDFRDNHADLQKKGYVVLGVSPQGVESKQAFTKKYGLNFPLLADEGGKVADAYGTWGEVEIFGNQVLKTKRSTFVIDEKGDIAEAQYGVRSKGHVERLRESLGV